MNLKGIIGATTISATLLAGSAVYAQSASVPGLSAQTPVGTNASLRGERGSKRDIMAAYRHVEQIIDRLQRDQRDFGGHREAAIDLLQKARVQLKAALDYDEDHKK